MKPLRCILGHHDWKVAKVMEGVFGTKIRGMRINMFAYNVIEKCQRPNCRIERATITACLTPAEAECLHLQKAERKR